MNILQTSVYVGPNPWAYFPVIRLRVDLGELEQWPTGRLGVAFQHGLLEALPGLHEHRCSYGERGGFVRRLTEGDGTWLGHVLEHAALELQNVAGFPVSYGRARGVREEAGIYDVVIEYREREIGLAAAQLAFALLQWLLPTSLRNDPAAPAFDFRSGLDEFLVLANRKRLGPSTAALVRAAVQRRIPWHRVDGDHLIQLGTGIHQTRVQGSITSRTTQLAVEIAQDKMLTARILRDIGIPVPEQIRVYDEADAVAAAERLGYPVVVKPVDGNHGRGVTPGLTCAADVRTAFPLAWEEGRGVIVEENIHGDDHRLLVVNGVVIAAARRVPAQVTGDGVSSIAELVDRVNEDPRRADGHNGLMTRIVLDAQTDRLLMQAGLTRASVPRNGQIVRLKPTANLSTGGTAVDVTDEVHPDNRELAVRAAAAVGLDVAGVDFITPDITRSHMNVGGGVCELNAAPGLRMHVAPYEGAPRDVAGPIIDHLYPPGTRSTIPIAAITGTNGKTTTARMVAHLVSAAGRRVGLTTTDGIYVGGRMIARGDTTGPQSAQTILRDATVECAVLETARGGILRAGLAFRHCAVGAVLNVTPDHLGLSGVETVEQMAQVKQIVVEVATDLAVLNADDPHCLAMVAHTPAQRVCLITLDPANPHVAAHLANGGLAIVCEPGANGALVFCDGAERVQLVRAADIPATLGGRVRFNIENAAFAAAIAIGLGVSLETVRAGLSTCRAGIQETPGRLNLYEDHPFRVIVDYAHNPAAIRAAVAAANEIANGGRRICVLAAPGDRRDDDIREVARTAAAANCDLYICRRDDELRGRGPDEVPELLREGLMLGGVPASRIRVVPAEADATIAGLRAAQPGDLLLLFADDLERTWQQVTLFEGSLPAANQDQILLRRDQILRA